MYYYMTHAVKQPLDYNGDHRTKEADGFNYALVNQKCRVRIRNNEKLYVKVGEPK
jgi:hypothetical protein